MWQIYLYIGLVARLTNIQNFQYTDIGFTVFMAPYLLVSAYHI